MNETNVLILSAGRRVELIKCFKRAARKEKISSRIITADISNMAPALYFSDKYYIIPKIGADNYIETIINICKNERIKLVVPTIDTELLLLAQNRDRIEKTANTKVLISSCDVIEICRNKLNTQKFLEENGFDVPKILTGNEPKIKFPVFIKPVDGSSSINAFKVNNKEELTFFKKYIKKPIIQELVTGIEYSVDAFTDFEGNIITIVPRQRIATRSGEIAKGRIVKDARVISSVKNLVSKLKTIGQITIQCIEEKDKIKYIEINPRFGGGAPMSISAGADSCQNLYKLLQGKKIEYNEDYKEYTFLRFDDSIMLNSDMELVK